MFILGMDIGYSNLKVACGDSDLERPEVKVLPAGAALEDYLPHSFMGMRGRRRNGERYRVVVDGEVYITGVEPSILEGWNRELHKDYPFTPTYRALFYTALLLSGRDSIDLLVTGLPVDQFLDRDYREKLKRSLEGIHRITQSGREVEIKEVSVIAQPMGGYLAACMESGEDSFIEAATLVFDVGFFSLDWVVIDRQSVLKSSSGTSIFATSWALERAADLISRDHGFCPGIEELETALRQNSGRIYIFSEKVDIRPYLVKVMERYGENIIAELKRSLRFQKGKSISNIVVTGGGSEIYRSIVEKLAGSSEVFFVEDPVTANVRGFWYYGLVLKENTEVEEE